MKKFLCVALLLIVLCLLVACNKRDVSFTEPDATVPTEDTQNSGSVIDNSGINTERSDVEYVDVEMPQAPPQTSYRPAAEVAPSGSTSQTEVRHSDGTPVYVDSNGNPIPQGGAQYSQPQSLTAEEPYEEPVTQPPQERVIQPTTSGTVTLDSGNHVTIPPTAATNPEIHVTKETSVAQDGQDTSITFYTAALGTCNMQIQEQPVETYLPDGETWEQYLYRSKYLAYPVVVNEEQSYITYFGVTDGNICFTVIMNDGGMAQIYTFIGPAENKESIRATITSILGELDWGDILYPSAKGAFING